ADFGRHGRSSSRLARLGLDRSQGVQRPGGLRRIRTTEGHSLFPRLEAHIFAVEASAGSPEANPLCAVDI
ncbi:hypothetical protein AAVH_33953, partial [Aphelenchoides avenae]